MEVPPILGEREGKQATTRVSFGGHSSALLIDQGVIGYGRVGMGEIVRLIFRGAFGKITWVYYSLFDTELPCDIWNVFICIMRYMEDKTQARAWNSLVWCVRLAQNAWTGVNFSSKYLQCIFSLAMLGATLGVIYDLAHAKQVPKKQALNQRFDGSLLHEVR